MYDISNATFSTEKVSTNGVREKILSASATTSTITMNYNTGNCFIPSTSFTTNFVITLQNVPKSQSTNQHTFVLIYYNNFLPSATLGISSTYNDGTNLSTPTIKYPGGVQPTLASGTGVNILTITVVYNSALTTHHFLGNLVQYR